MVFCITPAWALLIYPLGSRPRGLFWEAATQLGKSHWRLRLSSSNATRTFAIKCREAALHLVSGKLLLLSYSILTYLMEGWNLISILRRRQQPDHKKTGEDLRSKFVKFLLPPAISSLDKEIDNWWNYYFWSVSVFPKAIYLSTRRHPAAMPRESTFFCLILAVYLLMPFCYPLVWRVGIGNDSRLWPKRRDTSPVLPGRLYVKIWS